MCTAYLLLKTANCLALLLALCTRLNLYLDVGLSGAMQCPSSCLDSYDGIGKASKYETAACELSV